MAQSLIILRWYIVLQALGLAGLPLTLLIFRGLPDKGYPFSKALSILLVTYFNWIAVSIGLFSYSTLTLVLSALGLLIVSLTLLFRFKEEIIAAIRANLKLIGLYEILFLVVFLIFVAIKGHDPNIYGTEKFMDFSFITGISRNTEFPPQDQWLSGEKVNYYYFGYLIITNLIKLAAVPAEYGYNLALAMLAGLTFVSVSSIAYNLSRRVYVGIAAAIFMVFLGNLDGFREFLSAESISQYNWWNPSRVIGRGDTINEFPFFTLLHADLHPHVNALPFYMLMIASIMNIMFHRERIPWLYFGYLSILIGGLWIMNPWDLPLTVVLLWIVLIVWVMQNRPGRKRAVMYILAPVLILMCDRFILYAPFHRSFKSFSEGFGAQIAQTSLGQMLLIWGFFFFVLFTFLIMKVVRAGVLRTGGKLWVIGLVAVFVAAVGGYLSSMVIIVVAACFALSILVINAVRTGFIESVEKLWAVCLGAVFLAAVGAYLSNMFIVVIALCLALLILIINVIRSGVIRSGGKLWAVALGLVFLAAVGGCISNLVIIVTLAGLLLSIANLFFLRKEREMAFVLILVLVAFGVFLGCEFFYIKDTYGEKLYRMNTLFKFYFQAWTLVSIGAACLLPSIFAGLRTKEARWAWIAVFVALFVASLAYPIFSTNVRCGGFFGRFDLNGISYMARDHPGDYEAIMWLNENVRGAPVILEATHKDAYKYYSRVCSNTGLPTVLGWLNHEQLWREEDDLIWLRKREVDEIYNTTDARKAVQLLRKYGVRYVYVGEVEKELYKASGLRKFSSFMRPVWMGRGTAIYEFADSVGPEVRTPFFGTPQYKIR